MAGEEDLVAFHVPYVDVGKGYVGFFQGGIRIYVCLLYTSDATERLEELKKEFPQFLIRNWEKEEINVN